MIQMAHEIWYYGKTASEIVSHFEELAEAVYSSDNLLRETILETIEAHYQGIYPIIYDLKTEFWAYRHVNNIHDEWANCLEKIKHVRHKAQEFNYFF
jgi:hypothetical protein